MAEPQEPYKPHELVEIAEVPKNIEVPRTDDQIVEVAKFVYHQGPKSPNLLPPKYADLEGWLKEAYEYNYQKAGWLDVSPQSLDYLYQQFAVKMDERLKRNAFNTFGLYTLSYLDGLRTMGVRQGYLGSGGWEHVVKDKYRGLLLGCSSISTASEFFTFMNSVNPEADAIITDINPLAVKLAKQAIKEDKTQRVIQSDAQRIPLSNESVDFIATNFLVPNLIDVESAGKDTLVNVMKEIKRVLGPKGRLIMVEQLPRIDLKLLSHYAWKQGLVLSTGGPEGGILRPATILQDHYKAGHILANLSSFAEESKEKNTHNNVREFTIDPREYFGGQKQSNVNTLIFKHSKRR